MTVGWLFTVVTCTCCRVTTSFVTMTSTVLTTAYYPHTTPSYCPHFHSPPCATTISPVLKSSSHSTTVYWPTSTSH